MATARLFEDSRHASKDFSRFGRRKGLRRFEIQGREDAEAEALAELLLILAGDDRGQDTAEYGIALAVIGLIAGLVAILMAQSTGAMWSKANSLVQIAVDHP